ncbi:MAG: 4Fe-4S binding protein [Spirochaetaceae bacterium]|nr:4Fe-4S binding protein [Spirochaetaceae bacterium]
MDNMMLLQVVTDYINIAPNNFLDEKIALSPALRGMRIFDEPLVGFGDAGDPYFATLKNEVIGSHFLLPGEWNEQAKTVISIFFPFTAQVRKANAKDMDWPADEWLNGRIEGQAFIIQTCQYLKQYLEGRGNKTVVPAADPRFSMASSRTQDKTKQDFYTSNWSERHAAFICGLGTFGLSRGLITARGIAGRFGSLISAAPFAVTGRSYSSIYEYCAQCGACVRNCPAHAISKDQGKTHAICSAFLDKTREPRPPYYGCGKCQVHVPCEKGIPVKK